MVLSVAVEHIKPDLPTGEAERDVDPKSYTSRRLADNLFTVHVDSTRILTVQTNDDSTDGKWLSHVLRSTASNTKPLKPNADLRPDAIFVGLTAEDDEVYCPRGAEPPYGLLTICIGSHCLMHRLDGNYPPPKLVKAFFENPRVVVLGRDMANVAKKLKNKNGIEVRNAVDLNELAIRGMKRDDLDLGRYDLDRLAMTVLGKHYDVIRPEEKLYDYWTRGYDLGELGLYNERICNEANEKIMWRTLDAYLCLLIGTALEEAIHGARVSGAASKKNNKTTTTTKRSQAGPVSK